MTEPRTAPTDASVSGLPFAIGDEDGSSTSCSRGRAPPTSRSCPDSTATSWSWARAARWARRSRACVRRAADAAGRPRRVAAVSRFSTPGVASGPRSRRDRGDLLRPPRPRAGRAAARFRERPVPRGDEVRRLGSARPHLGPEHDRARPRGSALPARRGSWCSPPATSIPSSPPPRAAAPRRDPTGPVGEYAQSCLGRERVFEHCSRERGTPCLLFRLFYAVDLRYGVLVDIARKVRAGEPIDLMVGHVNVIWQGDANSYALRSLSLAAAPPRALNVTGPEVLSVRGTGRAIRPALRAGAGVPGNRRPAGPARQHLVLPLPPRRALGVPRPALRVGGAMGRDRADAASASRPSTSEPMAEF